MSQLEVWVDFAPIAIIAAAFGWGLARVLYLLLVQNVAVLSLMSQRKSLPEYGLAIVAVLSNAYLLLRPFVPVLDSWAGRQISPAPFWALGVMAFSILLIIFCQHRMGKSWRIGVPETLQTSQKLVTGGIYSLSRNPIYLAVIIYLAGLLLLLPGPFTLVSCLATYVLLRPVIAREEAFMEAAFGDEFRHYKQEVRRWI